MTATNVRVQMQQRRDTAANWASANPTLLSGELGYESDTGKWKVGNGSTAWSSLAYSFSNVVVIDGGNFATGGSAVSTSSTIDGGSFD